MTTWDWGNRTFKNHRGESEWLLRGALRRAIDIRHVAGIGEQASGRPAQLVVALNALKEAMGFDPDANGWAWLWAETD